MVFTLESTPNFNSGRKMILHLASVEALPIVSFAKIAKLIANSLPKWEVLASQTLRTLQALIYRVTSMY